VHEKKQESDNLSIMNYSSGNWTKLNFSAVYKILKNLSNDRTHLVKENHLLNE
jgi:hypothetical protein